MLNSREKFIWWITGDVTQPHSSVFWLAGQLKLSERKITCLNLEKCSLLLTTLAEIARETYGSVMHHLLSPLFSSYRTNLGKNDSFASEHSTCLKHWQAKQHWFFFKKDIYLSQCTISVGVPEQHTVKLGKIVLGLPKC